jgi:hypothetical protein
MTKFIVEDRSGIRYVPIGRLVTIGRSLGNDLVLNAIYASRHHAWAWRQGNQVALEDRGSMYGTFVNGQRLTRPRFLNYNDVITIGEARLTLVGGQDASVEQTPPTGMPRLMASQAFCQSCGAPNHPQAQYCGLCGRSLAAHMDAGITAPSKAVWSGRPITPTDPVVARPFPAPSAHLQRDDNRRIWILVLLLAMAAVILMTVVAVLWIYALG